MIQCHIHFTLFPSSSHSQSAPFFLVFVLIWVEGQLEAIPGNFGRELGYTQGLVGSQSQGIIVTFTPMDNLVFKKPNMHVLGKRKEARVPG